MAHALLAPARVRGRLTEPLPAPARGPSWERVRLQALVLLRAPVAPPARVTAIRIFAVALGLRVAFLTLAREYVFQPDYFGFGWEMGRIARALATGRGFADPFHGLTGPTAWVAPLYPFLLAGIFKLFGVYSNLSAWMALTFNSVCSAATAVVLYGAGRELFGERTGRRAGWIWAVLPYTIYWPTRVIWDSNLTALLLTVVFRLTVQLRRSPSPRRWAAFGLVWGLLALCNPATLAFAPVSWAWVSARPRRGSAAPLGHVLAAALLALACVAPWLVRNYVTFGELVFIRGNFGAELGFGNRPESLGSWTGWSHPTQSPEELDRYRRMGELAYVSDEGRRAVAFIRGDLPQFLENTARRVYWFWFGTTRGDGGVLATLRNFGYAVGFLLCLTGLGLMIRQRRPESLLFATLLLLYPLAYYVTFTTARYRHPIEPEMLLLLVYVLRSFEGKGARGISASSSRPA